MTQQETIDVALGLPTRAGSGEEARTRAAAHPAAAREAERTPGGEGSVLDLLERGRRLPVLQEGGMMKGYQLVVYGNAEPAGSKRAFYRPNLGVRVVDANPKSRQWKDLVSQEAGKVAAGLLEGALFLEAVFYRPRPANHYGTGKNAGVLKASAPPYPATRPDTTKLLRGIEDALRGVFYRDDAQIVRQVVGKDWGEPARVVIRLEELGAGGS